MSHTPGPWHRNIPPASKYPVVFAGRNTHVATIARTGDEETDEANINLIKAAPTMLEALEGAYAAIGEYETEARDAVAAAIFLARHGRNLA